MRIAQVAPLWETVPPETYGGTELVVHLLSEEMTRRGHDVTMFAATGSRTEARLQEYAPVPLRKMEERFAVEKTHGSVMAYELGMIQDLARQEDAFDVIHNHLGFQLLPFAELIHTPVVTTLHNALSPEPVRELFMKNAHLPYIAISHYQRRLWPDLNYVATIYHGVNLARFTPDDSHEGKDYLLFLGRLSPEKGPHHAVRIAKALNIPLVMAGKLDRVDQHFYDKELAQWVDGKNVVYVGEVDHTEKVALLRSAAATLCPVEWPEPFGLVMIESMACGTPVFALRDGSTPEVIDQGVTGFVADSVEELIEAVRCYRDFDRQLIRQVADERFSARRMADEHLRVYEYLMSAHIGDHPVTTLNRRKKLPGHPSIIGMKAGLGSDRNRPLD